LLLNAVEAFKHLREFISKMGSFFSSLQKLEVKIT
jgi:hypothetical protein